MLKKNYDFVKKRPHKPIAYITRCSLCSASSIMIIILWTSIKFSLWNRLSTLSGCILFLQRCNLSNHIWKLFWNDVDGGTAKTHYGIYLNWNCSDFAGFYGFISVIISLQFRHQEKHNNCRSSLYPPALNSPLAIIPSYMTCRVQLLSKQ